MATLPTINARQVIQKNIARFPQSADELRLTEQYYRKIEENQLYRLKNELARGNKVSTTDVALPHRLLEPGVIYRRNWLGNKSQPFTRPDGLPNGGYVDFISTDRVPMGDWDFPEATHPNSSITIKNVGDVYDKLHGYTVDNPDSRWQVYLTPGGVRAFDVARQIQPRDFNDGKKYGVRGDFKELAIDPNYAKMAVNKTNPTRITKYNSLYPSQGWAARISGKPGREGDFVAFPLGEIGSGIVSPYNRRIIDEYHDRPIMQSMLNDDMTPMQLPQSGLDLLNYHLDSIPSEYRFGVEQNLERLGVF